MLVSYSGTNRRSLSFEESIRGNLKMLLGKRTRPPMKKTRSMSQITFDITTYNEYQPSDLQNHQQLPSNGLHGFNQPLTSMVSPRNHRKNSSDILETADHFLRACFLCKRRLIPGRDIYMYRGDSAFCSIECRQYQMNQDERKEKKCSLASKKKFVSSSSTAGSQVPTKGETLTA